MNFPNFETWYNHYFNKKYDKNYFEYNQNSEAYEELRYLKNLYHEQKLNYDYYGVIDPKLNSFFNQPNQNTKMSNYNKRQYTDAEKLEYWKNRALNLENSNSKPSYSKNSNNSNNYQQNKPRSGAKLELVGDEKNRFEKLFAWKYTKKFGLMSLQAYKMKKQATNEGVELKPGYEKWRFIVKTPTAETTYFGMLNKRKQIFFFQMGTTKCAISVNKNYWSFLQPKNFKK